MEENKDSAEALVNRGREHYNNGEYDQAVSDFTEAISIDQNNTDAWHERGRAYHDGKKDYDKAIADYTAVIHINQNDDVAYNKRGNAYYSKKNYDQAIADYEMAVKIDSNDIDYNKNLEGARMAKRGIYLS